MPDDDFLTELEKQILPAVVRVSMPVADLPTSAYAEIADALMQLANQYQTLYRLGRHAICVERRLSKDSAPSFRKGGR